ncbi:MULTISPECIES: UPF0158 family protein [unclassified Streptomyces]|uniref:UPF0158 family protein n=1 Tax=unclassified Streptomyces TaxID=2593676 RepID=UPI00344E8527
MTEAWTDPALKAMRAACHTEDGPVLLALLRTHEVSAVLQQSGDALITAVCQGEPGARETAAEYTAALRERDWPGDEVLAAQLDTAVGGAVPALRVLHVDLEELSSLLEGDPAWGGGCLDLDTGACLPATLDAEELWDQENDEAPERWLRVPSAGSRDAYHDMEHYIVTLDDRDFAGFLSIAIQGPGAFRRFKDMLATSPQRQLRYWLFSAERQRGRARAWLADHGYRPARRGSP